MLFEPQTKPRVFATPLGVDFCAALIEGLDHALEGQGPEALARVEIHVANARMQRRLQALYTQRGPGLLPRIRPVLSLAETADLEGLPPAMTPLSLRLELAQLIARLIDANPDLAPRAALYDLADSLADFMGEMVEEGVTPEDIASLDMGEHSEHWTRARDFLGIAQQVIAAGDRPTPEGRQAMVVDRLVAEWRNRGATRALPADGGGGRLAPGRGDPAGHRPRYAKRNLAGTARRAAHGAGRGRSPAVPAGQTARRYGFGPGAGACLGT